MPLPTDTLTGFLGVNLRQDPLTLADTDVLRAINADLHRTPGAIRLRAGRTLQSATSLGAAVRTLARHSSRRYEVAGTALYRDMVSILTGLNGTTLQTTLVPYQPLLDTTTWSFIADQALMRKDAGTTVRIWGIVAPAAAPVIVAGAAGALTGDYKARYSYARVVGSSVAHESSLSPAPAAAVTLAAQQLSVPVIASADAQVTHIRVYRTLTGGSQYFFDQQVANTTATIASSQADSALGTAGETDNAPPPVSAWVSEFQGHLFLCLDATNPEYLWYSKRFRPEAWPTDQYLKLGDPSDPLQSSVALTGLLGVFSRLTKYRVFGNSVSGFTALEALNSRGIVAPQAQTLTSKGALFVARDGLFLTNFVEGDQEISQAIQGLFYGETINSYAPIDWAQTAALSLAEYKRRLYFGYQDTAGTRMLAVYSLDTQKWYHYQHPVHRLFYEETTDTLTMGDTSGQVWVMESGTTDGGSAIALTVQLPPRAGGDRFARKPYEWLAVDAEAGSGAWSVALAVDGTTITIASITGSRAKRYARLPEQTAGQQWQATATYTASDQSAALYAVEVLGTDHLQGQVWVEDPATSTLFLQVLPGQPGALPSQRRRFTFLLLDAEAVASGTWTADLYVDGTLAASVAVPGTINKHLHALPAELTGYEWYIRARYSSATVPLLYSVQALDTGVPDGQVWITAPGEPDAYLTVLPAAEPVDRFVLKRFLYLKLDAEAASGTWLLQLYVDGAWRHTATVTGDRQRGLVRLPGGILGYTWQVIATYSLTAVPQVFGVQLLTQALQVA